ncbi:hypothetical protein [Rhizobium sp. L1K21]|uniref:hypothetical protein n=1 Tax=Rhizobium sp. L1K21 TaxID=2954933 RepID=UPI002092FA30|nr:hypothetical protein [Rhizobium sp. L1K21]MCO6187097.1 hypothetical protein [Rhizobium sp. L1K21]
MIKTLAIGAWVVVVALGSVYFSVNMAMAPKEDPEAKRRANMETIRGDVTSLPVLQDGVVTGYFLTRLSYVGDKDKLASVHIPIQVLATDELFDALVGKKMLNLQDNSNFNLDEFRGLIKDAMNKKLGDEVIEDVLVEQIDYLSKNDIRSNLAQRNLNMQTGQKLINENAPDNGAHGGAEKAAGH